MNALLKTVMHENRKPHSLVKLQKRKLKEIVCKTALKIMQKPDYCKSLCPSSSKLQMLHFLFTAEWLHAKMERKVSALERQSIQ